MMFQRRHPVEMTPAELAAVYLAADEARWLAEEHGLSSYWEVARVLSGALPEAIVLLLAQVREARACAVDAAA
jgi:hypothetical protein